MRIISEKEGWGEIGHAVGLERRTREWVRRPFPQTRAVVFAHSGKGEPVVASSDEGGSFAHTARENR